MPHTNLVLILLKIISLWYCYTMLRLVASGWCYGRWLIYTKRDGSEPSSGNRGPGRECLKFLLGETEGVMGLVYNWEYSGMRNGLCNATEWCRMQWLWVLLMRGYSLFRGLSRSNVQKCEWYCDVVKCPGNIF